MNQRVGIDIVDNLRIKLTPNFLTKFLTQNELKIFATFEIEERKREFAAGRWAVKEAILKVLDDEQKIPMNQIDVGYNNKKLVLLNQEFKNIAISVSHERLWTVGIASYIGE